MLLPRVPCRRTGLLGPWGQPSLPVASRGVAAGAGPTTGNIYSPGPASSHPATTLQRSRSASNRPYKGNEDSALFWDRMTRTTVFSAFEDVPATRQAPLEEVVLHITASRNNTMLTLSDGRTGNVVNWASAGTAGLKKAARGSTDAGFLAATHLIQKLEALPGGFPRRSAHIKLSGFGPGREPASRVLLGASNLFLVKRITDVTPIRHGGCRPKKNESQQSPTKPTTPLGPAMSEASLSHKEQLVLQVLRSQEKGQCTTDMLVEEVGWDKAEVMLIINSLSDKMFLEFSMIAGQVLCKARNAEEVSQVKDLSGNERILFQIIKAVGNKGIWIKDIKNRSNLHSQVVTSCIKNMEKRLIIKAIKSIKSPTKKFYMLFHVEPSVELTGGAWYTDDELDVEFIDQLAHQLYKYILSKSRPKSPDAIYSSTHADYPTTASLTHWLNSSKITPVELSHSDVQMLIDRLIYDAKVMRKVNYHGAYGGGGTGMGDDDDGDNEDQWESTEQVVGEVEDNHWVYVANRPPEGDGESVGNPWTDVPCGKCPVFEFCKEGGPISPTNCVYYQRWLEF